MNEQKNSLRQKALLFFSVSAGIALISIALHTVNLLCFFEASIGYYLRGAFLPILEWIVLGIAVVSLLALSIVFFRKQPLAYKKRAPVWVRIGAALGAIGFGALVLSDGKSYLAALEELAENGSATGLIPILLGLGATVYFVLIALNGKNEGLRILTGFCVILRLLSTLSNSYFDFTVPMNAPVKLTLQLGILSAILFLINELRATVASPRPSLYMFFAGIATVCLGVSSLPSLVASYHGIFISEGEIYCYYALLGLFLYVTLRFLSLSLSPMREEADTEALQITEQTQNAETTEINNRTVESEDIAEDKKEEL